MTITPSSAHICDIARMRRRAANTELIEATRRRDIELNKRPSNMERAVQHEAQVSIANALIELYRRIEGEHCGLR